MYKQYPLEDVININKIISFHYFEFTKDYRFSGEKHDFWEFIFLDKGNLSIHLDGKLHKFSAGCAMLFKPNQYHSLVNNDDNAPNLFVTAFDGECEALYGMADRILYMNEIERKTLGYLIKEGASAFDIWNNDNLMTIINISKKEYGAQQLFKNYLENLFIVITRNRLQEDKIEGRKYINKDSYENMQLNAIIEFMRKNIYNTLELQTIHEKFNLSKSSIQLVFKKETGFNAMEYYRLLKINEAKKLIREKAFNFTEIADQLYFSSIHSFSKCFKKVTGMSPSQYAKSVLARTKQGY